MKDKAEKFLEIKEEILNNMAVLRFNLEKAVEAGMQDIDSELYNRLTTIHDDIKEVDSKEELEELVLQAQNVENLIDSFLLSEGQSTLSLSWPQMEE